MPEQTINPLNQVTGIGHRAPRKPATDPKKEKQQKPGQEEISNEHPPATDSESSNDTNTAIDTWA